VFSLCAGIRDAGDTQQERIDGRVCIIDAARREKSRQKRQPTCSAIYVEITTSWERVPVGRRGAGEPVSVFSEGMRWKFFGIERKSTPRRVAARAARGGLKIRRHCFGPGGGGSPLLTARGCPFWTWRLFSPGHEASRVTRRDRKLRV
jgi:hypothetical protein